MKGTDKRRFWRGPPAVAPFLESNHPDDPLRKCRVGPKISSITPKGVTNNWRHPHPCTRVIEVSESILENWKFGSSNDRHADEKIDRRGPAFFPTRKPGLAHGEFNNVTGLPRI